MDKAISYNDFQKALQKPIKTLTALEGILIKRIEYLITLKALNDFSNRYMLFHDDDLDIEYAWKIEDEFIAQMREKDKRFKLPLDFKIKDYEHFDEEVEAFRKKDEDLLRRTRQAISALQRYPNLLFMAYTLKGNGAPIDDLEKDLEQTNEELATINPLVYDTEPGAPQCFDIAPLNSTDSDLQKLNTFLAYYPRQVEKLELWLRAHTPELTFKNAQQLVLPPPTYELMVRASEEGARKAYEGILKENRKKQRARTRNSGGGRKPTFDVNNLQCQAYWVLREQFPKMSPSDCADKILSDPKWRKSEFKEDNPYLYTSDMTKKGKSNARKIFIRRADRWRLKKKYR